jgi:hypothetical protein
MNRLNLKILSISNPVESLTERISKLSLEEKEDIRYSATVIEFSRDFHERLIRIWKAEVGDDVKLPPLPNLWLSLPENITEAQLAPPRNIKRDAIEERGSHKKRPEWFARNIRKGEVERFKKEYGAGTKLSRARHELLYFEIEHDIPFYICYETAEVVARPGELDADHLCPWETLRDNIWALIDQMNKHPRFGAAVYKEFQKHSITRGFVYKEGRARSVRFYPTQWFFKVYFNDISNLLLSKKVENQERSSKNIVEYLESKQGQLLYKGFSECFEIDGSCILTRVKGGFGVGEAMRYYFYQYNESIAKLFSANLSVAEKLNDQVRALLEERQKRELTGRSIRGRIKAESHRSVFMGMVAEEEISSSDSSDTDPGVNERARTLTRSMAPALARAYNIATRIAKSMPGSDKVEIRNQARFIEGLVELIEKHTQ